ncbi:hypothetical protein [Lysobacter gummosus]|uniref:hypothetical protein n=1 Tax=Lysobacter gummosus TaxID=262324 RepID=UPI003626F1CF
MRQALRFRNAFVRPDWPRPAVTVVTWLAGAAPHPVPVPVPVPTRSTAQGSASCPTPHRAPPTAHGSDRCMAASWPSAPCSPHSPFVPRTDPARRPP